MRKEKEWEEFKAERVFAKAVPTFKKGPGRT
jgi:hypothetical protein